jgi:hypothetical protein
VFNILTNVFSEIIYEPINVGLSVKIKKSLKLQPSAGLRLERVNDILLVLQHNGMAPIKKKKKK